MDIRELLADSVSELQEQVCATLELLEQSVTSADLPLRQGQSQFDAYLRDLLTLLSQRLTETAVAVETATAVGLRAHQRRLYSTAVVMDIIAQSIEWLGVGASHLVSSGLNPHLHRLAAEHMAGPEVVVHTCPVRNYYSIMTEVVLKTASAFLAQLDPTLEARYRSFCLLALPEAEAENILLHAILYHELGHTVDSHIRLSDTIALEAEPLLIGKAPSTPEELAVFKQTLRRWVAELVADAFGVVWGGPSSVAAGLSLASVTSIDVISTSHPTDRTRYQLMCDLMDAVGSRPLMREFLPGVEKKVEFLLAQPVNLVLPSNTPQYILTALSAAHSALADIAPLVMKHVLDVTTDQQPNWSHAKTAVEFAVKHLDNIIVPLRAHPAPVARFLEPAELLLAGWHHLTEGSLAEWIVEARAEGEQSNKQVHRLRVRHYRLIEKALQDQELLKNWGQARERTLNK